MLYLWIALGVLGGLLLLVLLIGLVGYIFPCLPMRMPFCESRIT